MYAFTDEQKDHIIARLREHDVRPTCPRCGNNGYVLLGGMSLGASAAGGTPTADADEPMPAAVVACSRCGFVSLHVLRALGLEYGRQ